MKRFFMAVLALSLLVPTLLRAEAKPPSDGFQRVYPVENSWSSRPHAYLARQKVGEDAQKRQLQAILVRLREANHVPAELAPDVDIQHSDTLNASTDGKTIVITSGLLNRLSSDDERAFILSHELSHVVLQHIAKTQVRRIGLSLLDAFLIRRYTAEGSLVQLASELGIGLVDKRSARGFEYQADDLGVRLMRQAGYNPQAAIQVFDILSQAAPAGQTPEFLQDHPITSSRIRALVQKYKLSIQ